MNAMSLPQSGDAIGIVFKPKTFRAYQFARVKEWRKKEVVIRRLPSEIEEIIALKDYKTITVLSQVS
jgi:hypothetical protein